MERYFKIHSTRYRLNVTLLIGPLPQQKFLEHDFLLENLASETPIYIVTEGNEPPFFTRFFTWDSSKSAVSHFSIYTFSKLAGWSLTPLLSDAWRLFPEKTRNPNKQRKAASKRKSFTSFSYMFAESFFWFLSLDVVSVFLLRNLKGEYQCTAAGPAFQTNRSPGQGV